MNSLENVIGNIQNHNEYLYIEGKSKYRDKFIGFDLDGTLINYKDGLDPKFYPGDPSNWHFLGNGILDKLKELDLNYTIFIITNQLNVNECKLQMIQQVFNSLEQLPHILIANKRNIYRKPSAGFTNLIEKILQINNINFNRENSYYCGDTIGKNDPYPPYQRESGDDLQFSLQSGIKFIRPCDLFPKFDWIPYDVINNQNVMKYNLIIMMGNPGSGKTTYSKSLETYASYVRFSQDEVGDLEKQSKNILSHLMLNHNVVLDATFPSNIKRILWITMANKLSLKVAIVWCIRDGRPFNSLRETPVSHFAYSGKYGYTKNFNDPYEKHLISGANYDIVELY